MYPENPEGTQVIVGLVNMGYVSDTASRNRTHNLFPPKREPIPLCHSDEHDVWTECVALLNDFVLVELNAWQDKTKKSRT